MTITLIILCWLICSALSHGIMFAYFQKKYPLRAGKDYREDMSTSLVVSLFGPVALLLTLSVTGFAKHGLKFK